MPNVDKLFANFGNKWNMLSYFSVVGKNEKKRKLIITVF
jgi:hypothetical protein